MRLCHIRVCVYVPSHCEIVCIHEYTGWAKIIHSANKLHLFGAPCIAYLALTVFLRI